MIRVVMFDLGGTLLDAGQRPFAHAVEAVAAINGFAAPDGKPVKTALVSDFDMPPPPAAELFKRYIAILEGAGLAALFEPHKERVTLSSQAGVFKPDPKIFELALKRLKSKASFDQCLFITENAAHVAAARAMGMTALQFGEDFDNWEDGAAMIAELVSPGDLGNARAAIGLHLKAQGLDLVSVTPMIRANRWRTVTLGGEGDVDVAVPVAVTVKRDSRGKIIAAEAEEPSAEDLDECASYAKSLADHGQIGGRGSHVIEEGPEGRRRLVRRRMSAL